MKKPEQFIFEGKISVLSVGAIIGSTPEVDLIKPEEEDIPALYQLSDSGLDFQFTTLKHIVLGVAFDFQYEPDLNYKIRYHVSLENIQDILKAKSIAFEVYTINQENIDLLIENSGVTLKFYLGKLYKAMMLDERLYNSL